MRRRLSLIVGRNAPPPIRFPLPQSQIVTTRRRNRAAIAPRPVSRRAESPYCAIRHCFCRCDESTILPIKK
ncbi:hypothetical protein X946_4884 [Burkholderia sp. ABCPW 111]|nr:hypothetical protein X946_4884 [Burkholderia sp. ABCPW 111]